MNPTSLSLLRGILMITPCNVFSGLWILQSHPPKVRILADRGQRLDLFSALSQSGRLLPVNVKPERLPFAGGLFAVVKDLQRDRLVLDARPGNTLETPPSFWTGSLGSAAALLPMIIRFEESFRICTADLKDYFTSSASRSNGLNATSSRVL